MRCVFYAGARVGGSVLSVGPGATPGSVSCVGPGTSTGIGSDPGSGEPSSSGGSRVAPRAGAGTGISARLTISALMTLCALLCLPIPASPQSFADEMTVLGLNALVGGTTSGFAAFVADRPVLPAIGKGLAGGSVVYLGKRMSDAGSFAMSGLVGRMVAATGTSFVRNGAAGRGMFDLMVFPLGPVTLYKRPAGDRSHAPVKLHLARSAVLAALILRDDIRIDWGETLRAGAPVFDMIGGTFRGGHDWVSAGTVLCGTVVLSDLTLLPHVDPTRLVTHERIHVVQDDFAEFAWTGPIEHWVLGLVPGGKWLWRYVDVGALHVGAVAAAHLMIPYENRPWELEAEHFEQGGP